MRLHDLENILALPDTVLDYSIRLYHAGDEIALANVLNSSFDDIDWPVEKVLSDLVNAPDVKAIYVATLKDIPVATASARYLPEQYPGSGYLHWVGADPAHRGHQLGYYMTLAVLHHFKDNGCRDSVLETDDYRLPAIKTYLKLGYQPEHRDPTHAERWAKILSQLR